MRVTAGRAPFATSMIAVAAVASLGAAQACSSFSGASLSPEGGSEDAGPDAIVVVYGGAPAHQRFQAAPEGRSLNHAVESPVRGAAHERGPAAPPPAHRPREPTPHRLRT